MDINKYIEDCLIEHNEVGKETYYIIPKLTENIGYTAIEYIFYNLRHNNEFVAKSFLFSLLGDSLEPGPIFKEDVKVVLNVNH